MISRRYCFTINNPTDAETQQIRDLGNSPTTSYLVFGREIAPGTGTPHLQGFVVFATNSRFRKAKRLICERAHLEIARATSAQAAEYCKKEGDFEEYGTPPRQGERNDFKEFKEWVLRQTTKPTPSLVAREFPTIFLRYGRVMEWIDLIFPPPVLVEGTLRGWQIELAANLQGEADDRKIYFVVDPIGGSGKSWFVRYWLSNYGELTQRLSIGKRDDLAYAIDESKVYFFFDVPRSQSEYLQYSILEQLKDRLIFSPKYTSRSKMLEKNPFVVVFMNEEPDYNKLTADRYEVLRVTPV